MPVLTPNLKNKWEIDGYIKLENFYSKNMVSKLSTYLDDIAKWDISDDKWMMWYEKTSTGNKIIARVENFLDYHSELKNLIFFEEKINNILDELLSEKAILFKERIIYKYPDSGGYQPHQDIYSTVYNLSDREIYAVVAVFIDDSNEENGCVYFSPGKHKSGILEMDDRGVMYEHVYKDFKWEPMVCKAGDIVIFDNYTPHYSNMNKSSDQRRAIYFPFQKESQVSLPRTEYYKRKKLIAPPEKREMDINNLNKQNDIVFRN